MKRVHLFLTMLLLAIGVPLTQAQVYYTGSFTNPQWSASNAQPATKGENCYYIPVSEGNSLKISKVKADWNSGFNGNLITPSQNANDFKITPEAVTANGTDANTEVKQNGFICISLDYKYIQLCAKVDDFKIPGQGPVEPTGPQLYLVGAPNGWGIGNPITCTPTTDPAGWYYQLTKGQEFKVSSQSDGTWTTFNAGARKPATNGKVLKVTTEAQTTVQDGNDPNLKAPDSADDPETGYVWVSEDYAYIQYVANLDDIKLPGGPSEETKKFTIRFYNAAGKKELSTPCVHMWDAGGTAYKSWNNDAEKLTSTGKFYNINGTYYEVWEYEVETLLDLTSLKFHDNGSDTDIPEITGQTFEDGKTYIYVLNGKDSSQTRQLVDKPVQSKTFTIYFVNSPLITTTTKLSAPKVHLWDDSNHPYKTWNDASESMTSTGKYYLINGQYYPVWKYTVTTTLDLKNLLFFDNDDTKGGDIKNQTFEDGGSYIYNIQARGTVQNRPLVDKPSNNKTEVYVAGACPELGGWKLLATYKFSGPYADGSYRFDRPQMETGSDHAFKIIVRKYTSDTEYTDTWLGYDAIDGGNAYTEGKLGHESNGNIYFTEDANNVLFYYYPESGNIVITARFGNDDPVEDADEDVYIYFHTKYDLVRNGAEGAVPYAHCYNIDNHYTFSAWDTEAEKMERVEIENHGKKGNTVDMTEKYTLWRYRIPKEDVNGVNTVVFYYPDHNTDFHRYDSRKLNRPCDSDDTLPRVNADENRNDQDNWTKYIYTTASTEKNNETLEYAQQTFLTYDDFVKLDRDCVVRGGRTNVYFIGGGEGMASDITGPLTTTKNEDGCFYLPTKGNRKWFKCSWIEPDHFEYGEFDTQRYWSTFDLGLVSPVMNVEDENYDPEDGNGTYKCNGNVTVKYENYNQADWKLPENDEDFYIVVDSHEGCHTVTILYINPQPKLKLDYSGIRTVELTAEQAAALHVHAAHLNDLATPDDAPIVTRVNIATGTVEIIGADNADTDNHSLRYVLRANGVEAGRFPDSGKYKMDMMPVADYNDPESTNDITVRAAYTDRNTGNTFHSRIASVEVTNAEDLVAPLPVDVQGNYVCTRIGSTGREYFCINSGKIKFELETDTDLAYYPDFSFDDATLNYMGHDAQKLYAGNENESKVPFVDYGEHWSEYIAKEGNFGLMIHRELREDRLVDETVEGEIHAMYPFLINPDADFVKVEQNGPAMAATAADDLDYSKLSLAMMPASAPAKVSVAADSFITTAIETVGVDTDAEVMYFNLQGIRIHNPRQGEFYLRRAGNTTEKIRF